MMWNLNLEFLDLVVFGFWSFDFGVWILDFGVWVWEFSFCFYDPPTTKETSFLDLFVCTLVGRPWC